MSDLAHISTKPWSEYSEADYTPEQYKAACLVVRGDGSTKAQCKLPVKTPDGALSKPGVHAAAAALAGARGGVDLTAEERASAKKKLIAYYKQLNEEAPGSLAHTGVKGMKWGVRKDRPTGKHPLDTSTALHNEALKEAGQKIMDHLRRDRTYWERAAAIAAVGVAGLGAAAVAPGLLPASVVVGAGGASAVSGKILASSLVVRLGAGVHNGIAYQARKKALELTHASTTNDPTVDDVLKSLSPTQRDAAAVIVASAKQGLDMNNDTALLNVWAGMTDTQRGVIEFVATMAQSENPAMAHADTTGGTMANTTAAIMALPAPLDTVRLIGDEEKHATLLFFGETSTLPEEAKQTLIDSVKMASEMLFPFGEVVRDITRLGTDNPPALVAMLSDRNIGTVRNLFMMNPAVKSYLDNTSQFPGFTPHVTLGHPDFTEEVIIRQLAKQLFRINFDRLAVWWNDERIEIPLSPPLADSAEAGWSIDEQVENFLEHHGVKGMKWGVRKDALGVSSLQAGASKDGVPPHGILVKGKVGKEPKPTSPEDKKVLTDAVLKARAGALNPTVMAHLKATNDKIRADLAAKKYDFDESRQKAYDRDLEKVMSKSANEALRGTGLKAQVFAIGNNFTVVAGHPKAVLAFQKSVLTSRMAHSVTPDIGVATVDIETARDALGLVIGLREKGQEALQHTLFVNEADKVLAHHGVKGMKWGVRRTIDSATGLVKKAPKPSDQTGLKPRTSSEDQIRQDRIAKKLKEHGAESLSNRDIQDYTRRLQLEADLVRQVKQLNAAEQKKADGFIKHFIKTQSSRQFDRVSNKLIDVAVEKVLHEAGIKIGKKGGNPDAADLLVKTAGRLAPKKGK